MTAKAGPDARTQTAVNIEPILIRPGQGWVGLGAKELWRYRDLGYFLVWRDLKVRYRQTFFGGAWAVIQPVLLMLVFSAFLGRISGLSTPDVPYPLFALAGLVPWILFSQSVNGAANSLVSNQNLILKVYFPRLLLPLSAVASFLLDFVIASLILLLGMVLFWRGPSAMFVWVPIFGLMAVAVALAVGLWLAAINVRYRDVRYAVPFLVQVWLFASPVAYSGELIPSQWKSVFALNPMTGVIEGFRWAALGGQRPDAALLLAAVSTAVILIGGLAYFRRVERTFADSI